MKKIVISIIALALAIALFTVPVFAEDEATNTTDTDITAEEGALEPSTAPEIPTQSEEDKFYDKILTFVTDGANWAKMGGIVLMVIAAIGTISVNLNKVKSMLDSVISLVHGKATKDDTEKIIKENFHSFKSDFDTQYAELKKKYDEQAERNSELTAVITVVALQLVKSPYARTEIMSVLSGAKSACGGVKEIVEAVQEEITKAEAEEEKAPTPALDAIKESINKEEYATGSINMGW